MRLRGQAWLLLLVACGGAPRPVADEPRALLIVRAPAPAATLWIDERALGPLGALAGGVRLGPGAHRVELRLEGHHPRYAEVVLAPGETRVLELTLTEAQP
jgi:hypothetical protein